MIYEYTIQDRFNSVFLLFRISSSEVLRVVEKLRTFKDWFLRSIVRKLRLGFFLRESVGISTTLTENSKRDWRWEHRPGDFHLSRRRWNLFLPGTKHSGTEPVIWSLRGYPLKKKEWNNRPWTVYFSERVSLTRLTWKKIYDRGKTSTPWDTSSPSIMGLRHGDSNLQTEPIDTRWLSLIGQRTGRKKFILPLFHRFSLPNTPNPWS